VSVEDVVSAVSFVWSVSFNLGRLLSNNDLLRGDAIRPMAANVSENWELVVEAATWICERAQVRGLRFREHYQSLNSVAYLWAWCFAAIRWRQERKLKEADKDSLEKSLNAALDALMDRWLICSQWAGHLGLGKCTEPCWLCGAPRRVRAGARGKTGCQRRDRRTDSTTPIRGQGYRARSSDRACEHERRRSATGSHLLHGVMDMESVGAEAVGKGEIGIATGEPPSEFPRSGPYSCVRFVAVKARCGTSTAAVGRRKSRSA
jgi:hypothetical protein